MKRLLALLMLTSFTLLAAQTGTLKGTVTDAASGKPIAGVKVWVQDTKQSAVTSRQGKFAIKKVPAGAHLVNAEKAGYAPLKSSKVKIQEGKVTTLDVQLRPLKASAEKVKPTPDTGEEGPSLGKKAPGDVKAATTPAVSGSKESMESLDEAAVDQRDTNPDMKSTDIVTAPGLSKPSASPSLTESARTGGAVSVKPKSSTTGKTPKKTKATVAEDMAEPEAEFLIVMDPPPGSAGSKRVRIPQSGGLKAGFADDNQQFNYFVNFLNKYRDQITAYDYDISERIQFQFQDAEGRSLPNLEVKVYSKNSGKVLEQGVTYADGSFFFFPAESAGQDQTFQVSYMLDERLSSLEIGRYGQRKITIKGDHPRKLPEQVSVDIVFILDTTGSMDEEIKRLLATIDLIHLNLTSLPNLPAIRFGMVLYRDQQDEYVTRTIHPTADIDRFRKELEAVEADGGGDSPEDLQSALEQAIHDIDWSQNGLRLGFIITDAPPHLDYGQEFTYIQAAEAAKDQAIKLFTVGTGGLNLWGEYVLRQISQLTYAKYLFLTYGRETGENEGGRIGSVSHHTGSNYQTDKLDAIIIRIAKEEISHFTDEVLASGEDYFQADKVDFESREQTLAQLFHDAIGQMVDYSTLKIENAPRLGVLPVHPNTRLSGLSAEYFSEQLQLSVAQNKQFTLIARKDLQKILEEQKLQLSGLLTETETTQLGQLLGAELLLSGELYEKNQGYELFLKLLRVETAEILAVTKIILSKDLGL